MARDDIPNLSRIANYLKISPGKIAINEENVRNFV